MQRHKYFPFLIILLGLTTTVWAETIETAENLQNQVKQIIKKEASLQEKADNWDVDRQDLLNKISNLTMRSRWLDYRNMKYDTYIINQKKTINELIEKKEKAEQVRMELEPFLDNILIKLTENITSDLPFLQKERKKRIKTLNNAYEDYHLTLSEKLRRTMEALQIEAEYGMTIEKTEKVIALNGKDISASVLRIGRIGLFFRSNDNSSAGFWENDKQKWQLIPGDFVKTIISVEEMAERKKVVDLIRLPVRGCKL